MDKRLKAGDRCPVVHFDQESPEHTENWPEAYKQMRAECPRAWTEKDGGFWVATRYEDIVKILQSPENFSSTKTFNPDTGEVTGGITIPTFQAPANVPSESDNPRWYEYRRLLNRHFAPQAAEAKRPFAKAIARTLINRVIETGRFDIIEDLSNPLPAIFTMDLFGLPLTDWTIYADPIHRFMFTPRTDPTFPELTAAHVELGVRLVTAALERRGNPRDDLLSVIGNGRIDGELMTETEILGMCLNVATGGVDTTTSLTGNVLRYLSQHPEQRQQLIDNPSMIPVAREEFLRYFSPLHGLARNATGDFEMDGWQFRKGERVLLAYSSANRDEEIFEHPEELQLDRFPNRHIAFGGGIHRCLGSFYARVMFESMLEEVLERMPDYQVVEEEAKIYPSIAGINGWITIPATFTPGPVLEGGIEF